MRHFVIDTDTGSDDVWAIVAALRSPRVRVEAVTTVCGNLPMAMCVTNALHAAEAAGTYRPAVYEGCDRPLYNERPFYAFDCHGPDGLSGMDLPAPAGKPVAGEKAPEALVRLARHYAGELEIACCGPLTNIARALELDGDFARNVKRIFILGGALGGRGNMTEAAEYNVFVDPDAAQRVLDSGLRALWVPWDCACGEAEFSDGELGRLAASASPAARFCERCIRQMRDYYKKEHEGAGLAVIDSVLMLCALEERVVKRSFPAFCRVDTRSGAAYGAMSMDRNSPRPNGQIVEQIEVELYKKSLFELLGV